MKGGGRTSAKILNYLRIKYVTNMTPLLPRNNFFSTLRKNFDFGSFVSKCEVPQGRGTEWGRNSVSKIYFSRNG